MSRSHRPGRFAHRDVKPGWLGERPFGHGPPGSAARQHAFQERALEALKRWAAEPVRILRTRRAA